MLGCVYGILPLKLFLSHSLCNLPKLGLKYKIVKVVTLPLTRDHTLEADTCLSPTISVRFVCFIMGWKGTRICPSGTQGCVTQGQKRHTRKLLSWGPPALWRRRKKLLYVRRACKECWKEWESGGGNKGEVRNWRMGFYRNAGAWHLQTSSHAQDHGIWYSSFSAQPL